MMMGPCMQSLRDVTMVTIVMIIITFVGIFDDVFTENGPDHYAETYGWLGVFTDAVPMPLNTAVNFAYACVGIIWLCRINKNEKLTRADIFTLSTFNWMALFYSFIQLARLLTQNHRWAVMDQWYTLPFFAWTTVLTYTILYGASRKVEIGVMIVSLVSYCAALFMKAGFDYALMCHIIVAVWSGIICYQKYGSSRVRYYMVMSYLSCTLFVVLKVLDLELPKYHEFFNKVSGHFLSKIADFMQIYYVNGFMIECLEVRHQKLFKLK